MTTSTRTIAHVVADIDAVLDERKEAQKAARIKDTELERRWEELKRERDLATAGLAPDQLALAQSVIYVQGKPADSAEGAFDAAVSAVAAGGDGLLNGYIGAKHYGGFHQREDHQYGYGPKHGSTCFAVGLLEDVRRREVADGEHVLTEDEAAAATAYLLTLKKEATDRGTTVK